VEFLRLEPSAFTYGVADEIVPNVRRVIAHNPSEFTDHGTGTYIVGGADVVVIDPGPRLDSHREALERALAGATVRAILVTHCHADHSPLATWLAAESGAPTMAFGPHGGDPWDIGPCPAELLPRVAEPAVAKASTEEAVDRGFVPDVAVRTGDVVASSGAWRMTALHTPGHTSNHTCFAYEDGTTRLLFSGDHIMGWSTTVVSPPDGDMRDYLDSLRAVGRQADDWILPTHGPPIAAGSRYVADLVAHRLDREAQILDAVRDGCHTVAAIVLRLYRGIDQRLHRPAGLSVLAHLAKLVDEGRVVIAEATFPRLDATYVAA